MQRAVRNAAKRRYASPEDEWRSYLDGTHPMITLGRRAFVHIPTAPRCRVCYAPFHGPGGAVMRRLGFRQWEKSPNMCTHCIADLAGFDVVGVDVEVSFLFADIRRSSELARSMSTLELAHLMQRFYVTASEVLLEHDAILDKFVGDEAVGFFLPLMTGPGHATAAVRSARALLVATGHGGVDEDPWVSLGIGVTSGTAFVGVVSSARGPEFTAFGDAINSAAHLAAQAPPGEVLLDRGALDGAGLADEGLEARELSLKGHPTTAYVLDARAFVAPPIDRR